jgi:hypothetical protein
MAFPVQVYIAGARPRHLEQSSVYKYKPLCERQIRDGPWRGYRVGDIGKTSWGQLVYDSIIIHISEDGVQSWVRPVRMHTESKSTGYGPKQHWYELSKRLYSVFIKWPLKKKAVHQVISQKRNGHQVASLSANFGQPFCTSVLPWVSYATAMGEALLDIRLMLNLHILYLGLLHHTAGVWLYT